MTVRIGDVVTWTNQDEAPHDVVTSAGPVPLRSPLLATRQSWSFTFTEPGTYSYHCSIHPDMRAEIVVLPADPEPAQAARPSSPIRWSSGRRHGLPLNRSRPPPNRPRPAPHRWSPRSRRRPHGRPWTRCCCSPDWSPG